MEPVRRSSVLQFAAMVLAATSWVACDDDKQDPSPPAPSATASVSSLGTSAAAPPEPPKTEEEAKPAEPPPPHPGPWLWVTRSSAGIYSEPKDDRKLKFAYAQRGAKVPILEGKLEAKGCPRGWYKVATGGYICSHVGSDDEKSSIAKFPPRQPNLHEILPYPYARNAHNGTPLYKSMPSRAQMLEYEPHLSGAKKKSEEKPEGKAEDKPAPSPKADVTTMASPSLGAAGAPPKEDPWWVKGENLHEVTLEQLNEDADGILAKRMVKGFYVAIDKTFNWNGRTWYKTTKGLVAPTDRFWQTAGSDFQGVILGEPANAPPRILPEPKEDSDKKDGDKKDESTEAAPAKIYELPIGWVFGGRKTSPTYEIDEETKKIKPKSSVKKFVALQLTGKKLDIASTTYFQMDDGTWVRDRDVRITTPETRPDGVGKDERWIDVDLSEQTLVAYQGDTPIYATLISSGKTSNVKDKDHSTPTGMWRVREKHVTATMDGNGSAAGDLPYSIEDVPYVMYFHKAYALHGAFWHRNYGVKMSHGCVNLAPLDAKYLFFFADPPVAEGQHGAWSSDASPGTMVVVHD